MYVQNVGPGQAGPFSVDIFGSCSNQVFSNAPVAVSGLPPGANKFIRITFTFTATGACSVSTEIDPGDQVSETNEANNDQRVAVTSQ